MVRVFLLSHQYASDTAFTAGVYVCRKEHELFINLFIGSTAALTMDGKPLEVVQQNNYPWDGELSFVLSPASAHAFTVRVRIPGWVRGEAAPLGLYMFESTRAGGVDIMINGKKTSYRMENGYAVLNRTWSKGGRIEMNLPMPVREVRANDLLQEDKGKFAIQRGPLMYCAEWKDNAVR